MKYFYNENQERNLRKHYNIERPYAWLSRILLWHGYVSKNNLQTQCNHHQNSNGNLYITRANNSTLIWNHKRPTKIPSYPKKKEQEYLSTYFQYQRNKSIRTTEKNRQVDQPKKKKKRGAKNQPICFPTKMPKTYFREKMAPNSAASESGYSQVDGAIPVFLPVLVFLLLW